MIMLLCTRVLLFPLPGSHNFVVDSESPYSHRPVAIIFVVDIESPYPHCPAAIIVVVDIKSLIFPSPGSDTVVVDIESPYWRSTDTALPIL